MAQIHLAPSILAADFKKLEAQCRTVLDAGARWLHFDIMDGHFVPNISFGPMVLQALRPLAREYGAVCDAHLMISQPDKYIDSVVEAGADIISVHVEACTHLHRVVQQISQAGCRAGVAINPHTPLVMLEEILDQIDLVNVMSVNPGFAGQNYIEASSQKIMRLRQMIDAQNLETLLQVDGGVKVDNAADIVDAGATVLVVGSAMFGDDIAGNMRRFQEAVG